VGKAPGKVRAVEAHHSCGLTTRLRFRENLVAFNDGEGLAVVGDNFGELLQLGDGKGRLRHRSIAKKWSVGCCSLKMGTTTVLQRKSSERWRAPAPRS
jgi:hypothetical protein